MTVLYQHQQWSAAEAARFKPALTFALRVALISAAPALPPDDLFTL